MGAKAGFVDNTDSKVEKYCFETTKTNPELARGKVERKLVGICRAQESFFCSLSWVTIGFG